MSALQEFAQLMTPNLANLAKTYAHLLAEHEVNALPDNFARTHLEAVVAAFAAKKFEPLLRHFAPKTAPPQSLLILECLGQTLLPLIADIEAGQFLWQMLAQARLTLLNTLPPPAPGILNAQLLQAVVEQSPNLIVITNTSGYIEYVNPTFCRVTGYSMEEAVGKNPNILKTGEMSTADYQALWQTITAGQQWHGTLCNKKKNGDPYWASVSISPIKNPAGQITHYLGVQEEITAQREAQVERERLLAEAERRTLELNILDQVGRVMLAEAEMEAALRQVTALFVEHFNAAFARLWLLDSSGQFLTLRASSGLYTHLDGSRARILLDPTDKIGWIATKHQPHLTNDVLNDPRIKDLIWAKETGLVAFAGYPLLVGEELVGVLAMFAREVIPDEILVILGRVADRLAVTINNRHLLEVTERRARREQIIHEITAKMRTAATLEELVKTAAQELGSRLPAGHAIIELGIEPEQTSREVNEL
jgi:PAS domain S-box-containing protein